MNGFISTFHSKAEFAIRGNEALQEGVSGASQRLDLHGNAAKWRRAGIAAQVGCLVWQNSCQVRDLFCLVKHRHSTH